MQDAKTGGKDFGTGMQDDNWYSSMVSKKSVKFFTEDLEESCVEYDRKDSRYARFYDDFKRT